VRHFTGPKFSNVTKTIASRIFLWRKQRSEEDLVSFRDRVDVSLVRRERAPRPSKSFRAARAQFFGLFARESILHESRSSLLNFPVLSCFVAFCFYQRLSAGVSQSPAFLSAYCWNRAADLQLWTLMSINHVTGSKVIWSCYQYKKNCYLIIDEWVLWHINWFVFVYRHLSHYYIAVVAVWTTCSDIQKLRSAHLCFV